MKAAKLILIFIAVQVAGFAQEKVLLNIPAYGRTFQEFIPAGYDTLATAQADLNKDGLPDVALVIANKNEDSFEMDEEPKRILLILLKKDSNYTLAGKSTEAILRRHCGGIYGDPFAGIDINKGVLDVMHYGGSAWRWSEDRRFRFQKGEFYLIGSTSDSFWINGHCDEEGAGTAAKKYKHVNWLTGDVEIIERDENCKLIKHKKFRQKIKPLVRLVNFKYDF